MSGLARLTITGYEEDDYEDEVGTFEVLINPDSYTTEQKIEYIGDQPLGSSGAYQRFSHVPPAEVTFNLVFDGTNLISTAPQSLKGKSVPEQIEAFNKVATDYSGSIHRPYSLRLTWGTSFFFLGVLTDLSITYKMFKPDGTPLRADAKATFKTSWNAQESLLTAKDKSPDMTHVIQVRAGDTLPGLCDRVYDDANHFVQVAAANDLDSLRGIPAGRSLSFPPLIES